MTSRQAGVGVLVCLLGLLPSAGAAEIEITPVTIRAAVAKALPLLEKSTAEYPHQRDCFSCHHQAVPVLALTLGQRARALGR